MKTLIAIYTLSLLFAAQAAMADAPMSSMEGYYDQQAKMCRKAPKEKEAAYAAAAADPAGWLLSLAPKREKTMLASCCTQKKSEKQARAE